MTNTMAFAISTPTTSLLHSSSSTRVKPSSLFTISNTAISIPKNAIFQHIERESQMGFTPFSQWNGLKQLGIPILQYSVKKEKKGKWKGKKVYASLFGVGAPEALVIGVVALLVFGPKGLAEVARNLGKTLRAFQPTIRELQEVSREFKSTLEREIGLDEPPVPKPPSSNTTRPIPEVTPEDLGTTTDEPNGGSPTEGGEYSTEDYLRVSETQLKGALARLQKEQEEEKEREEMEKAQLLPESSTPAQDDTQAQDTAQESDSLVMSSQQSPESNPLQEVASVIPPASAPGPSPAPKLESES